MSKSVLITLLVFCSFSCLSIEKEQRTNSNQNFEVEKVIQEFSAIWIDIEGVEGIAEGKNNNQPCIHLYISKEFSSDKHPIPKQFKGINIQVEETDLLESL